MKGKLINMTPLFLVLCVCRWKSLPRPSVTKPFWSKTNSILTTRIHVSLDSHITWYYLLYSISSTQIMFTTNHSMWRIRLVIFSYAPSMRNAFHPAEFTTKYSFSWNYWESGINPYECDICLQLISHSALNLSRIYPIESEDAFAPIFLIRIESLLLTIIARRFTVIYDEEICFRQCYDKNIRILSGQEKNVKFVL